jgi:hypothetical protein
MAINFTGNPDYIRFGGLINLNNLNLANLNVLGTTNAGSGTGLTSAPYTSSITRPNDPGTALNVGETFTLTRTPKLDVFGNPRGTPQTLELTMQGSGTFSSLLGGTHDIIVARTADGNSVIIFPDSDAPGGLLGTVGNILASTISAAPVGWDFSVNAPLCFTRGTMLETPEGSRAIEDLKVGDIVLTKDNGAQPIRWISSRVFSQAFLERNPNMCPILIQAGALGRNTPTADLIVSPQHRILVRSKVAQKMFGTDEVLVAAKQLLQVEGIDVCDQFDGDVEYFHMLFDQHEVVFANGAEAESLYTGPQAIKSVGAAALEEIYEIFPELRDRDYEPKGARMLLSGRMGRKLVSRHLQHSKPLVAAV